MLRFRLNPSLDDEIRQQADYGQALRESAEAVQSNVAIVASQAGAPWIRRQAETVTIEESGDGMAVVNTDYLGHILEWGSIRNPPHAPLRRGARSAGLQLKEQ